MAYTKTPEQRGYYLTDEVAALLMVSSKTINRWAKEGRLTHTRTLGGHRRYPLSIRQEADRMVREMAAQAG